MSTPTPTPTRTAEQIQAAIERRVVRFPLACGLVEVAAIEDVTPRMRRFTFAGEALRAFPNDEPGEIVTFIWPAAGREVVLPETGWRFPPEAGDQHSRNYTVRRFAAHGERMEVDFVLHGDHGRASRWAARAQVGDVLGIAGPRMHWVTDLDAEWTLLVGDETALPAIGAIVEQLPAGHPTVAIVEVADGAEQQRFDAACDLDLRWLHRDGAPASGGSRLVEAVRQATLPSGRAKVWAAGESLAIRDVREHLRDERGLPPETLHAIGYWRHRDTPDDVV
ncbi:siderophore-interacting protein [Patulibacter defluvii]|uniref:siderophore-interacting protein n=1 Tax=Patulibacter defluvii TaxID=3095358 RepID=UPI002A76695F|nr:siderophore-interacting protein [Patulibacter sp. DM4]